MLTENQKKSLKEISGSLMRYRIDLTEETKAEEIVSDLSFTLNLYLKQIIELQNPTVSEIASLMRRSKPSVTIAIDKLEAKGYVHRVRADNDKRSFHLYLTEKGKKFKDAEEQAENKMYERMSNTLSEKEIINLIRIVQKIFQ